MNLKQFGQDHAVKIMVAAIVIVLGGTAIWAASRGVPLW